MAVIMHALTRKRVSHQGRFHNFRDVPMELEPFQKPHPPLWYGVISPDSAARAARAGMSIIANTTAAAFRSFADRHRAAYQPPSGSAEPPRMGINRYIVLAEDEHTALDVARRAYRPWHANFMALWRKYDRQPMGVNYPPEIDGQVADGRAIATTPAKALSLLRAQLAESSANYLVLRFAFGDLTLSESLRSLELFQRHVMPGLRESVAVAAE